jgi:hypothetical protein
MAAKDPTTLAIVWLMQVAQFQLQLLSQSPTKSAGITAMQKEVAALIASMPTYP